MVYGKHKRKTLEKQNKRSLISGRIGLQSCFIIFKLKQKIKWKDMDISLQFLSSKWNIHFSDY